MLSSKGYLRNPYGTQTAQFGSAIHHAMARCFEEDSHATQTLPALIRHQGFRKRQLSGPHASASVSASAVHSVARRPPSVSAPGNARPTRSATFTSLPGRITPFAMPTSLLPGLNTTVTYPAAA
ncbi:MAG: hypothetical protein L6R40_000989 [Gallowayella cf. fulva]|nr:MAG: hypothetical protein L6R40_000989 [Xanthomendoza cf. fulva]